MAKFSNSSLILLDECHPDIQIIMHRAIEIYDFKVLCGYRDKEAQNAAYPQFSSLRWPESKHNQKPSRAIDIAPYPVDWNDLNRFYKLDGVVETVADWFSIPIVWGGTFNNFDGGHFELKD